MNKRISDIFDYGADIAPAEANVSFDPECIRKLTMEKLGGAAPVRKGKRKMKNTKRIILVAAAIVMALVCSAFTFYKLGVIDLLLPEEEAGYYTRISVTGWRNTPEYLAAAEWAAYETEYNSTHEVPNVVKEDIPIEYQMAGAWSAEMEDTLRGILDKYGLKLHDSAFVNLPAEGSGIDTDAILNGSADWVGGYAYSDGTMLLDAEMKTAGGKTVSLNLFNAVKGTFTNISGAMHIGEDYDEWGYTAPDGTALVLGLSGGGAIIVADMERVFVTANVSPVDSREELEAAADCVNWTELNNCTGYSAEYYAVYAEKQAELMEEDMLAFDAENEMDGQWGLTMSVGVTHRVEVSGRSSEASGDGSVWVERRFVSDDAGTAITIRYERYADGAQARLEKKLSDYGMTGDPEQIADVPVYIAQLPDGALRAVWYDEFFNLVFTLESDAGELTMEELRQQIVYVITGQDTTGFNAEPVRTPAESAER